MAKSRIKSQLMGFALVWAVASAGCGERDEFFDRPLDLLAPLVADDHLVFIERGEDRVHLLDLSGKALSPVTTRVPLPSNPLLWQHRNGSDDQELLLLCEGREQSRDEEQESPSLVVLNGARVERRYELESSFNGLIQSEDGRYAFLFFDDSSNAPSTAATVGKVETMVTFVDLSEAPARGSKAASRRLRKCDECDGSPNGVFFSPVMSIAGEERRLAAVVSDTHVWLLDLNHPERPEITFEPRPEQASRPEQVLFGEDEAGDGEVQNEAKIYVRAANSDDVYIVDLVARPAVPEGGNDFEAKDTARAAGQQPRDIALYKDGAASRLLVVSSGSMEAVIIDPDTSMDRTEAPGSASWPVRIPLGFSADSILYFEAGDPEDPIVREPRALLYSWSGSPVMAILDLKAVEHNKAENLEVIHLKNQFEQLVPWDEERVLLLQSGTGPSVLDLAKRESVTVKTPFELDVIPDRNANKLWLAPFDESRLGYVDLRPMESGEAGSLSFDTGEVRLDAAIHQMALSTAGERKRVVILHENDIGHITVLDADRPERDSAVSLKGFFLADVLERGE